MNTSDDPVVAPLGPGGGGGGGTQAQSSSPHRNDVVVAAAVQQQQPIEMETAVSNNNTAAIIDKGTVNVSANVSAAPRPIDDGDGGGETGVACPDQQQQGCSTGNCWYFCTDKFGQI